MIKAYILACGNGKKMWPYSDRWQKCTLPIGNVPCIERLVMTLEELGVEEIVVVASYKAGQIKHILDKYKSVSVMLEENYNGTAQSLLKFLDEDIEDFIVLYGDVVIDKDSIKEMLDKKNQQSMLIKNLGDELNSTRYMCAYEDEGKIKSIYGHPRRHYVTSRVAGVFLLNKKIIPYLKSNPGHMMNICVGAMPSEEYMLEQSIQAMIEDGIQIHSVEVKKYFIDLDNPYDILIANEIIIRETVEKMQEDSIAEDAFIDSSAVIEGRLKIGKGSSIGKNVIIKGNVSIGSNTHIRYGAILDGNNIIGDDCVITDYCMICGNTTIGNKNKIGFNAQIEGVTFEGVSMVHSCEIYGVVGSRTDIAAGCTVGSMRFDDKYCNDFAGTFGNAVIIGDYVRTGVNNTFCPGVKVGSCSCIYPGAIVSEDVSANTLLVVKQERLEKRWGSDKYNW